MRIYVLSLCENRFLNMLLFLFLVETCFFLSHFFFHSSFRCCNWYSVRRKDMIVLLFHVFCEQLWGCCWQEAEEEKKKNTHTYVCRVDSILWLLEGNASCHLRYVFSFCLNNHKRNTKKKKTQKQAHKIYTHICTSNQNLSQILSLSRDEISYCISAIVIVTLLSAHILMSLDSIITNVFFHLIHFHVFYCCCCCYCYCSYIFSSHLIILSSCFLFSMCLKFPSFYVNWFTQTSSNDYNNSSNNQPNYYNKQWCTC